MKNVTNFSILYFTFFYPKTSGFPFGSGGLGSIERLELNLSKLLSTS